MTPLGFLAVACAIALFVLLCFSVPIAYYSARLIKSVTNAIESADKTFDETKGN